MLAVGFRGAEARVVALDDEAAHDTVKLGPDDGNICDGAVGDPHLGAVEQVAVVGGFGSRHHAAGVRAVVGLSEAETADEFALRHTRQVALLLRLAAEGVDRVHAQRALHRDEAANRRVAALDLLADESVGDVAHTGTAVAVEVAAQHSHRAEFGYQFGGKACFAVRLLDDGDDLRLGPVAHQVAYHHLFFVEEALYVIEIDAHVSGHVCPWSYDALRCTTPAGIY